MLVIAAVSLAAVLVTLSCIPYSLYLPAYRLPHRGEGELRLHILDVGQGDAEIVEFPGGDLLVVDAGNGSLSCRNLLIRYIKGLKKEDTKLRMLLIHADIDHYGGFRELLSVFGAELFYLPVLDSPVAEYRSLLGEIGQAGVKTERARRYLTLDGGDGAYAVFLNPYSVGEEDANDSSAVL